jgi:hypothetical protein
MMSQLLLLFRSNNSNNCNIIGRPAGGWVTLPKWLSSGFGWQPFGQDQP